MVEARALDPADAAALARLDFAASGEWITLLREIARDVHALQAQVSALQAEIDTAKHAVTHSKNPIIRSLFPWL